MALKDGIQTTASIDGVVVPGEFKTFSGGEAQWANRGSRSGSASGETARGGRQTIGNVTIGREDDGAVDLKALAQRPRGIPIRVTRTPRDDSGNLRVGDAWTFSGVIVRVAPGEADIESEDDLDTYEIEMRCNSTVS